MHECNDLCPYTFVSVISLIVFSCVLQICSRAEILCDILSSSLMTLSASLSAPILASTNFLTESISYPVIAANKKKRLLDLQSYIVTLPQYWKKYNILVWSLSEYWKNGSLFFVGKQDVESNNADGEDIGVGLLYRTFLITTWSSKSFPGSSEDSC